MNLRTDVPDVDASLIGDTDRESTMSLFLPGLGGRGINPRRIRVHTENQHVCLEDRRRRSSAPEPACARLRDHAYALRRGHTIGAGLLKTADTRVLLPSNTLEGLWKFFATKEAASTAT